MIQKYGIFLGCGEICRLHHPAVQRYAVLCLEGEEFFLRYLVFRQGLFQRVVSDQCAQYFTRIVIQSDDGRSAQVGITVHVVLHVRAELCAVDTFLCGKLGLFSLAVYLVHSLAERTFFIADVIATVYFIVSAGNLFNQISTHAVPVQMIITAFFAQIAEVFGIENDIVEYILLDIRIAFVTQHLFANRGTGISEIHIQTILMTVQCDDGQFIGILRETDARDVAISIHRYLHLAGHFRLDVKGMYGYL